MNELEKITKKVKEGKIDLGKMNSKLSKIIELDQIRCMNHNDCGHMDYDDYSAHSDSGNGGGHSDYSDHSASYYTK